MSGCNVVDHRFRGEMDDVIRVLVSTDNHLGYMERNPVRGDDSFLAFEEALQIAKQHGADFVLLAGDLFHDNKPSRSTLHRCMLLLRKYCFGSDPVAIEYLSEPQSNFAGGSVANYMDENLRIDMPIFTIHGNHDDPTGAAGPEQLSIVDILHDTGLVNYFGKVKDNKSITIEPILLKKGDTKLALYGLGNIRDERLYTTWVEERNVVWTRPTDSQKNEGKEGDGWFNVFALHQNRVRRGSTKGISEDMLPQWLDIVIWGHEHECRIDLEGGASGPLITQPGSSVATSLIEGESKGKHVGFLDIHLDEFRWRKIPLQQVRRFVTADIILSNVSGLDPIREKEVEKYLTEKVENMLSMAERDYDENHPDQLDDKLRQPLIRLRVERSGGFGVISPHRFGLSFVGRVANFGDILHFYTRRTGATGGKTGNTSAPVLATRRKLQSDEVRVPDLVRHYLRKQKYLEILSLSGLSGAVDRFVNKVEPHAIVEYVNERLKNTQTFITNEREKAASLEPEEINALCEELARRDDQLDQSGEKGDVPGIPSQSRARAGTLHGSDDVEAELPERRSVSSHRGSAVADVTRQMPSNDDVNANEEVSSGTDGEATSEAARRRPSAKRGTQGRRRGQTTLALGNSRADSTRSSTRKRAMEQNAQTGTRMTQRRRAPVKSIHNDDSSAE